MSGLGKLKEAMAWPEFRMVWVLLGVLAIALALEFGFLPPIFLAIEAGLFLVAAILVFASVYKAAAVTRGSSLEQGELKSILYGLEDGLIVYDRNFNALFMNPAAEKLFLLTSEQVLGHQFQPQDVEKPAWRRIAQVIFPSLAPVVINRSESGASPQITDLSFTEPTLELRVATAPIADDAGKSIGFVKIVRNRTREVSLIKSKTEFLTIASHQLRTPLTEINWGLETLNGDTTMNENSKGIVLHTLGSTRDLLKIVEDLLNVAKIEEGRFGYTFESNDILTFIGGLLAQIVPMAKRAGIKIYFDRPKEAPPQVLIDPSKLSLAVNNVIVNAIRYNVENGEVIVKVETLPDKPFVQVSVRDTGIGIPKDSIENLFKKFYRTENAIKTVTEGTGLGLYIAKNVIQAHGGKIWVESEPNRGSVFYFTLPTDPNLVPKHEAVIEE